MRNGHVIDGTGNPWFKADVGIRGDRIASIGRLGSERADREIDAEGLVVAPGFVEIHSHSEWEAVQDPRLKHSAMQGITTSIAGQCGQTLYPVTPESLEPLKKHLTHVTFGFERQWDWSWRTLGDFLKRIEERGVGVNLGSHIGHWTIRLAVMGMADREPTDSEMEEMRRHVERGMKEGAFGLSSGLVYPPGSFATTEELIELCKVVARYGGFYSTHIRGEGDEVERAVGEAIEIGERAGVPVEIAHLKVAGKHNWGRAKALLGLIDAARARGVDVTCDQYPYGAATTMLKATLPPWVLEGSIEQAIERLRDPGVREKVKDQMESGAEGFENFAKYCGWDGIYISFSERLKGIEGKNIAQIARERGTDPYTALFDILVEDQLNPLAIYHMIGEEDIRTIMAHPATSPIRDNVPDLGVGKPHPRVYGTYPRVLGRYVREQRILRLEDAIRKMTSLPAQRAGLRDRGLLREGMHADITVFDPETVIDRATYDDPRQYPEGIEYVIINGRIVVEGGEYKGVLAGRVLRHGLG